MGTAIGARNNTESEKKISFISEHMRASFMRSFHRCVIRMSIILHWYTA